MAPLASTHWHRLFALYRARLTKTYHGTAFFPDDFSDLLQELALRIVRHNTRYQPERSSFTTFVDLQFRTVITDILRRKRAKKRGAGRTVPLQDSTTVEHPWDAIDFANDLAAMIGRLSACQRQLIRDLQGDTVAGVARGRGVGRDKVREEVRKLRRALKRLNVTASNESVRPASV